MTMYPDQQKLKLIREAVEEQLAARSLGTRSPEGLFAPIDYTLRLGGKRIRPLLAACPPRSCSPRDLPQLHAPS